MIQGKNLNFMYIFLEGIHKFQFILVPSPLEINLLKHVGLYYVILELIRLILAV